MLTIILNDLALIAVLFHSVFLNLSNTFQSLIWVQNIILRSLFCSLYPGAFPLSSILLHETAAFRVLTKNLYDTDQDMICCKPS